MDCLIRRLRPEIIVVSDAVSNLRRQEYRCGPRQTFFSGSVSQEAWSCFWRFWLPFLIIVFLKLFLEPYLLNHSGV